MNILQMNGNEQKRLMTIFVAFFTEIFVIYIFILLLKRFFTKEDTLIRIMIFLRKR